MTKIYIHPQFHTASKMAAELQLEIPSEMKLGDLIRDVCGGDKRLLFKILDETGTIRPHVAIFVGNDHCKYLGGLDANVAPSDDVSIYPALSGG
ncbi:MAG: hypothetical protein DWQ47_11300 [Acidobacteria bacterium]|nr:MAG: hypothetical protein DWQ32_13715 [Acidobacteriota bacterium]REJ98163.1 MAG: hypothetical protein DWQ38_16515 [Acidobacteriota bacterium]REK16906.1 MAG: hypothetical protein DWQ43_01560 [Acidobacteriota bacterium]REK42817.1 MAG: hypothetical protein DWQ47_11300 [Acidobacteriota bacterium]